MIYTPAEWGAAIGAGLGAGGTAAYAGWLTVQKLISLFKEDSNVRRPREEAQGIGPDRRGRPGDNKSCIDHTRRLDILTKEIERVDGALRLLIQGLKERIDRVGQSAEETDKLQFEQLRLLSGLIYEVRGVLMGTRKAEDG